MENSGQLQNLKQQQRLSVNGLGIAGMVIGIVCDILCFIGVGLFLAVVGIVLSGCAFFVKNTTYGMALAGVIMCAIAIIINLF